MQCYKDSVQKSGSSQQYFLKHELFLFPTSYVICFIFNVLFLFFLIIIL